MIDSQFVKPAAMKTINKVLISSFLLMMTIYLLLPLLIYVEAGDVLFSQWFFLQILNILVQPFLIGYSVYYLFRVQNTRVYWLALFLTTNTLLFLLPVILIGLCLFGDPINFQLY